MNRRSFLSGVAGTVVAASADRLSAAEPSRRRVIIGFLGASHSHALAKVKIVSASSDYELIGIAEESADVRKRYAELKIRWRPPAELLQVAEAIAVESDVRDHARHAMLALKAGKHVHVEKPPSDNLADLKQMVTLAREKKLLLQSGYMWRYHPGFQAMFEAARKGWLGDIYMVRGTMSNFIDAQRRPEWAEFKGGSFFELASHLLDAVVRLLGKPKAITSHLRRHGQFNDELKDNNVVVLEYDRALAVITNSSLQPNAFPHRSFEILGSNGTAVLRPIEPPSLQIDLAKAAGPYKAGTQTIQLPAYRRYEADLAEFAAAIRGEKPLSVSLDQELLVQEVLLQACKM